MVDSIVVGRYVGANALAAIGTCNSSVFLFFALTSGLAIGMGIIGIALYNGIASVLRALGDSKTPLYFLFLSAIVNIVLDLWFVIGFNLGVFGAALATVMSQYISCITCAVFAIKKVPYFRLTREELKPEMDIILNSFKLGVPIALQNSMIAISMMVLQGVVNTFGTSVMAAYTVVGRVEIQSVVNTYSVSSGKINRKYFRDRSRSNCYRCPGIKNY